MPRSDDYFVPLQALRSLIVGPKLYFETDSDIIAGNNLELLVLLLLPWCFDNRQVLPGLELGSAADGAYGSMKTRQAFHQLSCIHNKK